MKISHVPHDAARRVADDWQADGVQWHFHMLPPRCVLNTFHPASHVLLLENCTAGAVCVVETDGRDHVLGRHLAETAHPTAFEAPILTAEREPWLATLLSRLRQLSSDRVPWHHHMLLPRCAVNAAEGGWVLLLEADGRAAESLWFDAEPSVAFHAIEQVVWCQP